MSVRSELTDRTLVLAVSGELDISNVEELNAIVAPLLDAGDVERIVLDAQRLRFADSSAIALWVRWANRGVAVELREPGALLRTVVLTMGLGALIEVTG